MQSSTEANGNGKGIQTRGRTSGVRKSVIPSSLVTISRRSTGERSSSAQRSASGSGKTRRASAAASLSGASDNKDREEEGVDDGVTPCRWAHKQLVLARDDRGDWYAARVIAVDEVRRRVHVHFNGWNARHDLQLPFGTQRIRPAQAAASTTGTERCSKSPDTRSNTPNAQSVYHVGDFVLARWGSISKLLPAKVLALKPAQERDVHVVFEDGLDSWLAASKVKHMTEADFNRFNLQNVDNFGERLIVRRPQQPLEPVVVHGKRPSRLRDRQRYSSGGGSRSTTRASSGWPTQQGFFRRSSKPEVRTALSEVPTTADSVSRSPTPQQHTLDPPPPPAAPQPPAPASTSCLEEEQSESEDVSAEPLPVLVEDPDSPQSAKPDDNDDEPCIDLTEETAADEDEPLIVGHVHRRREKKKKKPTKVEKKAKLEEEVRASSESKGEARHKSNDDPSQGEPAHESGESQQAARVTRRASLKRSAAGGETLRHSKRLRRSQPPPEDNDEEPKEQELRSPPIKLTVKLSLSDMVSPGERREEPSASPNETSAGQNETAVGQNETSAVRKETSTEQKETSADRNETSAETGQESDPDDAPLSSLTADRGRSAQTSTVECSTAGSTAALPVASGTPAVNRINLDLTFATYSAGRSDWLKREADLMYCVACRHYADSHYERTQLPMVRGCQIASVHEIRVHENLDAHERKLRAYYTDVLKTDKAALPPVVSPEQHSPTAGQFVCPVTACGRSHRSESLLQSHLRHMHSDGQSAPQSAAGATGRRRRRRMESTMSTATDMSSVSVDVGGPDGSTQLSPAAAHQRSASPAALPGPAAEDTPESAGLSRAHSRQSTITSAASSHDSVVRCICSDTEDDGFMIQCEQCETWQHGECVRVQPGLMPRPYLCRACILLRCERREHRLMVEDVERLYLCEAAVPGMLDVRDEQENEHNKQITLQANHLIQQVMDVTACLRSVRVRLDLHQHTKTGKLSDDELVGWQPLLAEWATGDEGRISDALECQINQLHPLLQRRLCALQAQVKELEQRVSAPTTAAPAAAANEPANSTDEQHPSTSSAAAANGAADDTPAAAEDSDIKPSTSGDKVVDENRQPLLLGNMGQLYRDVGKMQRCIELATSDPACLTDPTAAVVN